MKIALFTSGFTAAQLRLQPWLTLLEVGTRLQAAGHEVCVATDAAPSPGLPLPTHTFRTLAGTESRAIAAWLRDFAPDRTVVSVSPFSLATAGWHAALDPARSWAFLPYALYTRSEIARAWPHLLTADRWGFGRNLVVPPSVWRTRLARRFRGVLCQSQRTVDRLGPAVRGEYIPAGVELDRWCPDPSPGPDADPHIPFVFMGSPKAIRGFDVLLDAMRRLPAEVRLRLLARGLDGTDAASLRDRLAAAGLAAQVAIVGGWLPQEALVAEIRRARAVVLPFVLVPSELPVSVPQTIACGTPVIVTDIDGLPGAAGTAGLVVPAGDAAALATAMDALCRDPARRRTLRAACTFERERLLDWDAAALQWTARLEED